MATYTSIFRLDDSISKENTFGTYFVTYDQMLQWSLLIAKKQLDSGYIDDWLDIELQKKAGILLDAYYTQEELDALSEEEYKEVFHQAEICALGTTLSLDCFQNNSERAVERFNKVREGLVTACQLVTLAVVLSNPGTALAGFAAAGNGVVGVADGAVWVSQGEEKTGIYEIGFSMLDIYGGLKILDETTGLKNLIEPIKNNKGCINYYPERSGADNLAENVGKKVSEGSTNSGGTFKSKYDIPTTEKGYTKSSLELGKKVHKEYMSDVADDITKIKEYVLPSGKRVDFIDLENKIVYELKPNNPNQIKKGTKQLAGYLDEIESVFGGGWSSVLDTY